MLNKREIYRNFLPYGKWICSGGREVLFNRNYKPLLERNGNCLSFANPNETIKNINEIFYYDDGCPPYENKESLRRCADILIEFGVFKTDGFKQMFESILPPTYHSK